MSGYSDAPYETFPHAIALLSNRRVKLSAGNLVYAGAEDIDLGVVTENKHITGAGADLLTNVQLNIERFSTMVADGAISADADVYAAASGKVTATVNGNFIGKARTAAAADGDYLTVQRMRQRFPWTKVATKTADYNIEAEHSGMCFDSTGAAGTIVGTLPPAVPGLFYFFRVGAAQAHRIDPDGTETISLPSTGVAGAAGKYLGADAAGETLFIMCVVAGTWNVFGFTGTWTAEA